MELYTFDFVPKYLYIGTIETNGEIRGNYTTLFFADLGTNVSIVHSSTSFLKFEIKGDYAYVYYSH